MSNRLLKSEASQSSIKDDDRPGQEPAAAQPEGQTAGGRRRKAVAVVSRFLRQQYGIKWSEISAKLRATLLEGVEHVSCNLCGADDPQPIAQRDKYGLPITTVICRKCGLLYLNPRPTAATYRRFYEGGGQRDSVYHRKVNFASAEDLLKVYYGPDFVMDDQAREAMAQFIAEHRPQAGSTRSDEEPDDADDLDEMEDDIPSDKAESQGHAQPSVDYYGQHIYDQLKHLVPVGGKVFEPGASWGKMLYPWKVLHGCEATGVEPKVESVRKAKEKLGLDLVQGFSDDPRIPENAFDLVLNTRTINHMLDPLGDLRHAWRWLKPGGILFVDIPDVIQEARYESLERRVIEIDHTYMFSINTLTAMVQKAGFIVEKRELQDLQQARSWDDRPPQPKQIRIIARKTTEPVAVDWPDPLQELGALLGAQLEYDRSRSNEEAAARRARRKARLARREAKAKLKKENAAERKKARQGAGLAKHVKEALSRGPATLKDKLKDKLTGKGK